MFFRYRYSPLVAPEIRNMESVYDSFLISANSAILEEVLFRLFILSTVVLFVRQIYAKIFDVWPLLASLLPGLLALVVSSLLFAIAHNVSGFTAAFAGGLVLGSVYLKGGVESAIAAHFVANFLFFGASDLV
jgi:membrane protease YdiL (CAAX protease family)